MITIDSHDALKILSPSPTLDTVGGKLVLMDSPLWPKSIEMLGIIIGVESQSPLCMHRTPEKICLIL